MATSLRLKRPAPSRSLANTVTAPSPRLRLASAVLGGVIGATALLACAAGGADPAFWESGGDPAPGAGGTGGAGGAPSGAQTSSSTGNGPSTTSSTGTGTSSHSSAGAGPSATSSSGATTTSSGHGATSSSTSTTSSTTTSTTSSSGAVTWTEIYNSMFGPSGTSTCAGGSCHTNSRNGFQCSSNSGCCESFVSDGYVTQGSGSTSSALTDPSQSCLCGVSSTGNMPKGHSCVTTAQIAEINAWLATGAACN